LRRVGPQLRLNGVSVDFVRGNHGRHVIITHPKGPIGIVPNSVLRS
jgi:hypothetical protein